MTTTTKHTPGPWELTHLRRGIEHINAYRVGTGASGVIAEVLNETDDRTPANAALIAAAPDLLAALKEAERMLNNAKRYFPKSIKDGDKFDLLNVLANSVTPAIAKAEGK